MTPPEVMPTGDSETPAPHAGWSALAVLFLLLALAVSAWVPLTFTEAPQDDAYITYRYARNFVDGHGIVFNPGEPPVEGYTNFLWTVIIAGGMEAGVDPEWLGPALGLLSTVLAALLTALLVMRLGGGAWFAGAAALLLAVQPTQTVHAVGGLETATFGMLLLAAILPRTAAVRTKAGDVFSGCCLAAAALTRPEGMLVFGLLEIGEAFLAWSGRQQTGATLGSWFTGALRRGLPVGLVVGAHMLWRHATYGDWVPNTFHAKVAPGPVIWLDGLAYAGTAVQHFGIVFFVLPFFLLRETTGASARLLCLLVSTAYTAYVVSVGGDYMPTFRFLAPVLPLWCALAASSMGLLGRRLGGGRGAVAAFALLIVLGAGNTVVGYTQGHFWPQQARQQERLVAAGRTLDEILPPDAWMAATACGRVPYFAQRRCLDMMGLSDKHIASTEARPEDVLHLEGHLKGDGGYILDQRPEVIVYLRLVVTEEPLAENPNWPMVARSQAFAISEAQIARDPRLRKDYHVVSVPLPEVGAWLNVFALPGTFDASPPAGMIESAWAGRG